MLIYLMNVGERNVAVTLKRLFEKKIIVCAGGDFSKGNIFYQKQVQTDSNVGAICFCKNLIITGK